MPGDTVYLMDGVYHQPLWLEQTTGTESAWITFKADECATPILEGPGDAPDADVQNSGIGSQVAQFVRFQGIVSRGWNIGFGNGWNGGRDSEEISNGNWEIEHCIAYSNGRTGFTFFSAPNFKLKNSITAHNGTSTLHSWSSGVTLYEATGTNLVEGVVSFENTDEQKRTDGSGFIVDEEANNATLINNIAFRNAGSCLRLTKSHGTKFINNTCYQNSQFGARAVSPTNPGEIYFTGGSNTTQDVTFMNNVLVGTGMEPAGAMPVQNQPAMGWTNNVVTIGSTMFFVDPVGLNPNYVPNLGAAELLGKGGTGAGVPATDIGFDPKCIVKRAPLVIGNMAKGSWWEFDVDIDYIKSIGGVAKCWNPGMRPTGNPDIGAYKTGSVTTATPGACVPPPIPPPSMGGMTGAGGTPSATGGTPGAGGVTAAGGISSTAGGTPASSNGGTPSTPAGGRGSTPPTGTGGTASGTAGTGQPSASGGTSSSAGGSAGSAVTPPGSAGTSTTPAPDSEEAGCGCRVAPAPKRVQSAAAFGLALGLGLLIAKRRRRSRALRGDSPRR